MTSSDQPMDHIPPHTESGNNSSSNDSHKSDLENNLTARATWVRLAFMILYMILYAVSRVVTVAVIVVQFFTVLLTGAVNEQLKSFGHSLAIYAFEIVDYLTFNSEVKPFPIDAAWPHELPQSTSPETEDL